MDLMRSLPEPPRRTGCRCRRAARAVSMRLLRAFIGALLVLTARQAAADTALPPGPERHYVLSIDGGRVFVDLGRTEGISEQQVLQVFRTGVSFDHPVSGQKLVGTTYLGDVRIVEVSDVFSIAEATPQLLAQIKPGYEVRFRAQDLDSVQSARERIRELEQEAARDSRSWQERIRRGMAYYNNSNNRISTYTEMVRFQNNDQYVRAETDFTYRLFRAVYAVRFGIGAINGYGPIINPSSGMEETSNVAFYFGYSSIEFRFAPYFSMAPTFQLGLNNNGIGQGFGLTARLGPELGTNLQVSGSITSLVGSQLSLAYNHFINERVALSGSVAWEDYVTGESSPASVRVLLGGHFELTKRLQLDVKAGLGGRDVQNIGPSVLLGLSFNFPTGLWWMQEMEQL